MKHITYQLVDEVATGKVAEALSRVCMGGLVIYLEGPLGAGKTTFTRHFLRALGYHAKVKSPTFTLVEPYVVGDKKIYHFDLYRLTAAAELEYIGVYEYFTPDAICVIEWPEKGKGVLPAADLRFDIAFSPVGRTLQIEGCSAQGAALVEKIETYLVRSEKNE